MNQVYLSMNDYENIKKYKKCIGSGVDGSIYKINNSIVYKFYHKGNDFITNPGAVLDEDGVIISDFKSLRPYNRVTNNEHIYYTDGDGVILSREEAIFKAIDKQKDIKLTDLPKKIIYLNNKIVGCEYKYYPQKFGIYASAYLPLKARLIICKKIMIKVKELLDNNIYPLTLAQRDDMFPFKKNGSNVLLGHKLEPIIVDLDGISAMYSNTFSNRYYKQTLVSLSSLILELLSKVEIADNIEDDEMLINELINSIHMAGISLEYVKKYIDNNMLEFDDLSDIIKSLELKKNR